MSIPKISSYPMPTKNELPAGKVSWKADPNRAVLLIHDMQQYFLDFYENDSQLITQLVDNISTIKQKCTEQGMPVIYTAQPGNQKAEDRALLTDFWGPGLDDNTEQTKIIARLTPTDQDIVQTKWRYSAFKKSNLLEWMKENGKDQIIICGVYAHIGCIVTAVEAFMNDIQPFIVADAMADFSQAHHHEALIYGAERCARPLMMSQLLDELSLEQKLSAKSIKNKVADLLDVSPQLLSDKENLVDSGLDSIRMMMLVEDWRSQGIDINFMELAEAPTLEEWYSRLIPKYEQVQQ